MRWRNDSPEQPPSTQRATPRQAPVRNTGAAPLPERARRHPIVAPLFPLARRTLPLAIRDKLWSLARTVKQYARRVRRQSRRVGLLDPRKGLRRKLAVFREVGSRIQARRLGVSGPAPRPSPTHPRIVFVCLEHRVNDLVAVAEELKRLQRLQPATKMALLVDVNAFRELRPFPIAVEQVPPRTDWNRHRAPSTWLQHLRGRVSELRSESPTDTVVHLPTSGSPEERRRLIARAVLTAEPSGGKRRSADL